MQVTLKRDAADIDWSEVFRLYQVSEFDNGRGAQVLCRCFEKSQFVCFALCGKRVIGTARAISDEISCAAVFDVCVHPDYRRLGVGHRMVRELLSDLGGQFVILTTTVPEFYKPLGFHREPRAMSTEMDFSDKSFIG